jgi:hypothetical protein
MDTASAQHLSTVSVTTAGKVQTAVNEHAQFGNLGPVDLRQMILCIRGRIRRSVLDVVYVIENQVFVSATLVSPAMPAK